MFKLIVMFFCLIGSVSAFGLQGNGTSAGEKACLELKHNSKQEMSMLKSLLLANSQQIFAINNLQKQTELMRKRLDEHQKDLRQCKFYIMISYFVIKVIFVVVVIV